MPALWTSALVALVLIVDCGLGVTCPAAEVVSRSKLVN